MLRYLLTLPFVVLLVAFALSNPAPVRLGLWPTDLSVELPLSIAILGFSAVSFFLGALITWLPALGHRGRATYHAKRVAKLEEKLAAHTGASPLPGQKLLGAPKK
jgi:uncharacterized integral membrane protein